MRTNLQAVAPRRGRLLVAEDDTELRTLLVLSLRRSGFEVVEAADGRALLDALELTRSNGADSFDVIVSDIRMPGYTTLDVLAGADETFARAPVVLITAFGDRRTHERARRLGAAAVLDKPVDLDELVGAVNRLLGR
jgi:CheY-like chemotaxis protein